VKLSPAEYRELMRQDPDTSGEGGFQHFLVDLQHRINKQTRTLELTESDLDRIYKCLANPSKGGWQGRITKIFGRHFPEALPG
jgi:hypothetical protein